MMLAERYVPKDELKKVAKAILIAQDIREESWIYTNEEKTIGDYQLNNEKSAAQAVKNCEISKDWISIIAHWNNFGWNDIQWWAQEIIRKDRPGQPV